MERLRFGDALFVVAGVSAAAIGTLYGGAQLLELTFAPFALVDWLARAAPGGLITFFIDSMVRVLQTLSVGDLSSAAKTAEMLSGVIAVVVVLTTLGMAVWLLAPARGRSAVLLAAAVGAVAGAGLAWIITVVRGPDGMVDAVWTVLVLAVWGTAIGWARARLSLPTAGRGVDVVRIDRRRFLVTVGGASAVLTVAGATVGLAVGGRRRESAAAGAGEPWSSRNDLPNAGARVKPAPGTRAELTPLAEHYRIDINTVPPAIGGAAWRLRMHGLVRRPLDLTLDQLRSREARHQFITLACISNPVAGDLIGTTRWSGVPLRRLLDETEPLPEATHLVIRSADGFDEVVAMELVRSDDRIMLAYDWDGVPLTADHGYPLRIYIPDRYGMKQPKWIREIEAIGAWQPGYWVRRGWDREARMKATSVVDAIAMDMMNAMGGPDAIVPIGGIAHAGARGISRVEVRVDGGSWAPAQLRQPLSETTWVIWRYDWPFRAGNHTVTVRCVDGDGRLQIAEPSPPHPAGATGLHSKTAML